MHAETLPSRRLCTPKPCRVGACAHRDGAGWRRAAGSPPSTRLTGVPRVVVSVMPKPEILDPQGKAVHGALARLGVTGITDVRQGKRFELEVDGEVTDEVLAQARSAARLLLSNPVIEDVVSVTEAGAGTEPLTVGEAR